MKKKIGAFGAGQFSLGTLVEGRPGTTIFQNPGGREGGGLGGGRIQGPGPAAPPCCIPNFRGALPTELGSSEASLGGSRVSLGAPGFPRFSPLSSPDFPMMV